MSVSSELAFRILEKIGAPLLGAMDAAPGLAAAQGLDQARFLADFLGKSVHGGVALAEMMGVAGPEAQADSIRLGLTALMCAVLAGQVRDSGRVPGDRDVERHLSSFQAILSFADGFSGAADAADRLETMDPAQAFALDETQIDALFLRAFVPVIEAVSAFPFGHSDRKLVQDICERLVAESRRIAGKMPASDPRAARRRELVVLSALTPLYAACHTARTRTLMALDSGARATLAAANNGVLPMEPVWEAFALRVAMLESLAGFDPVRESSSGGAGPMPEPPPAPEPEVLQSPSVSAVSPSLTPPATPAIFARPAPPPVAPAPPPPTLQPPPDSGIVPGVDASTVNPMRFFKPGGTSS